MAYEYKMIVAARPTATVEQLNALGAEHWRLAAVYEIDDEWIYIFARRINADGDYE
jgi:hypothetical protein